LQILLDTQIGKVIRKLAKHNDEQVAKSAQTLMKRYRKVMIKYATKSGGKLPVTTPEQTVEVVNHAEQTVEVVNHDEIKPPTSEELQNTDNLIETKEEAKMELQ